LTCHERSSSCAKRAFMGSATKRGLALEATRRDARARLGSRPRRAGRNDPAPTFDHRWCALLRWLDRQALEIPSKRTAGGRVRWRPKGSWLQRCGRANFPVCVEPRRTWGQPETRDSGEWPLVRAYLLFRSLRVDLGVCWSMPRGTGCRPRSLGRESSTSDMMRVHRSTSRAATPKPKTLGGGSRLP
jgi:hypothetical protein